MCETELTRFNYCELLIYQVYYRPLRNDRFVRNLKTKVKFSKPLGCSRTLGYWYMTVVTGVNQKGQVSGDPSVSLHPGRELPSVVQLPLSFSSII